MSVKKPEAYDREFLEQNMMGPNSMVLMEELLERVPLRAGMRVLDLGCGSGLTSIFLAREYRVQVFAVDLWIPAGANFRRFQEMGVEDLVIPLHADARDLPFAQGFFDAVVSADAYHYFGNNETFFREKLAPLLKAGGWFALAVPGMKQEIGEQVPEEMKPYWEEEALSMWHSIDWWRPKIEESAADFRIWEMKCFRRAWEDWLRTENPYAAGDRAMLQADGGRYMNLIGMTGTIGGIDEE